jgi:hypothetical protein
LDVDSAGADGNGDEIDPARTRPEPAYRLPDRVRLLGGIGLAGVPSGPRLHLDGHQGGVETDEKIDFAPTGADIATYHGRTLLFEEGGGERFSPAGEPAVG